MEHVQPKNRITKKKTAQKERESSLTVENKSKNKFRIMPFVWPSSRFGKLPKNPYAYSRTGVRLNMYNTLSGTTSNASA